MKQEEELGEID